MNKSTFLRNQKIFIFTLFVCFGTCYASACTRVSTAAAGTQPVVSIMQTEQPASQPVATSTATQLPAGGFTAVGQKKFGLSSPDVVEGGALPAEYTCDGASSTLALTWSGAPAATQSFAVIMHHVAGPGDTHWYWVLYDIPATVTSLSKNSTGIGTLGNNSVKKDQAYTPPCSKGPGDKLYTYTVYALSARPRFSVPAADVSREVLLQAIQSITLASAELHVTYARK